MYLTTTKSGYFLPVSANEATCVDPTAASGAGCAHDMWSLGCLLATLYTGDRLFPVPKSEDTDWWCWVTRPTWFLLYVTFSHTYLFKLEPFFFFSNDLKEKTSRLGNWEGKKLITDILCFKWMQVRIQTGWCFRIVRKFTPKKRCPTLFFLVFCFRCFSFAGHFFL